MDPQQIVNKCLLIMTASEKEPDLAKVLKSLNISDQEYKQHLKTTIDRVVSGGPVLPFHLICHITEKKKNECKNFPVYAFGTVEPYGEPFNIVLFECRTQNEIDVIQNIPGMTILTKLSNVNSNTAMDEFMAIEKIYRSNDPVKDRPSVIGVLNPSSAT